LSMVKLAAAPANVLLPKASSEQENTLFILCNL
jgi:hypothetical protein